MSKTGLVGKVMNRAKSLALATGLGLAALLPTEADAQSANLSVKVKDANGNEVAQNGTLIEGQQYTMDVLITPYVAGLDVSSFKTDLKLSLSGLTKEQTGFDYAGAANGQFPNGNGTPTSNDVFAGANMDSPNTYFNAYQPLSASFQLQRAALDNGSLTLLENNPYVVASFQIKPYDFTTGGSLEIRFDENGTLLTGGANTGFAPFGNGTDLLFFGLSPSDLGAKYNLNFTPVPELATWEYIAAALGGGLLSRGIGYANRRRKEKAAKSAETREI